MPRRGNDAHLPHIGDEFHGSFHLGSDCYDLHRSDLVELADFLGIRQADIVGVLRPLVRAVDIRSLDVHSRRLGPTLVFTVLSHRLSRFDQHLLRQGKRCRQEHRHPFFQTGFGDLVDTFIGAVAHITTDRSMRMFVDKSRESHQAFAFDDAVEVLGIDLLFGNGLDVFAVEDDVGVFIIDVGRNDPNVAYQIHSDFLLVFPLPKVRLCRRKNGANCDKKQKIFDE